MTQLAIANCLFDDVLPGAMFADAASHAEFAPDRRQYDAAVAAYAAEISPAALAATVAAARRAGFRMTKTAAREAAVDALRNKLMALGYDETELQRHAARRGRRDRALYFADAKLVRKCIVEAPEKGGWRGCYTKRH